MYLEVELDKFLKIKQIEEMIVILILPIFLIKLLLIQYYKIRYYYKFG